MEAIGQLAGGVAHDFNNLLTAILGYCDLVLADLPAASRMASDVGQIQAAGERARDLTQQLLAFSRKQVMHPHVVNLKSALTRFGGLVPRLLGEHIQVTTAGPAGSLERADRSESDGADPVESRRQRQRRDARRGPPGDRDAQRGARRRLCAPASERRPGAVRAARGQRHRLGHEPGGAGPRVRAVLHDQADRQGDRARPVDRVRHRQTEPRVHLDLQRGRARDDVQDLFPARHRPGTAARSPPSSRRMAGARRPCCSWKTKMPSASSPRSSSNAMAIRSSRRAPPRMPSRSPRRPAGSSTCW